MHGRDDQRRERRRHELAALLRHLEGFPSSACAAVAPRQTSTRGLTSAISVSSHGRQAAISPAFGFVWIRRLPRGSHLKCFTTLVT